MTTDITELALLVSKAKASVFTLEYISQFEPADIDSDDVDLRFEVDGRDTGTNVSIVDECGQAARVIGALVEALEKAQSANAAQDDHINQQQDRIEQLEKRNAELGKYAKELESFRTAYMEWSDKTDWVQGDKRFDVLIPWGKHRADVLKAYIERLELRNAELEESHAQAIQSRDHYKRMSEEGLKQLAESRTVTVKLSKDHVDDADLFGWGVVVVPLEALKEACADAGVTVEINAAGIKWEAE